MFSPIVLLVAIVVVGYYVWKLMKNRAAAFAADADRLGYTYSAHDSPFTGTDIDGLSLITGSSQHVYRNVLIGRSGSPVVISEFQYSLFMNRKNPGSIGDDEVQNHTLIAFRVPHGSLPKFQVFSHGIFGNMGMPLEKDPFRALIGSGVAGLDLGNEEFAKRYRVFSEDSTAVRMRFSPFLMRALLEQPKYTWLHIQASPDWLLFYDPAIRILKPEAIAPALARLQPIVEMITGKAPMMADVAGATAQAPAA